MTEQTRTEPKPLTVQELIDQLTALPDEMKRCRVMASYDAGYGLTDLYDVGQVKKHKNVVVLFGD